jgi:1-acyl-sn-glycerol-3-phosphate acyltransferase
MRQAAAVCSPRVSLLRVPGLVLFTAWVWLGSFAWMLVGATITLLLLAVGLPYQRVHGWVTAPMFACVPRLATARVRVVYHPDFDPARRSVFCQNHVNLLDGHIASAAIPHAFSGLMNAWQFKIPIYGWLMTMSKGIAVHRGRRDQVIADISAQARQRKAIGMSVLTFPEGHRTLDGKVRPFRTGVFLMARNAGMPVVPLAVHGLYGLNNKRTRFFHPLQRVTVFVGPQLETEGLDDDAVAALAERTHAIVAEIVERGEWPPELLTSAARPRPT